MTHSAGSPESTPPTPSDQQRARPPPAKVRHNFINIFISHINNGTAAITSTSTTTTTSTTAADTNGDITAT